MMTVKAVITLGRGPVGVYFSLPQDYLVYYYLSNSLIFFVIFSMLKSSTSHKNMFDDEEVCVKW